jgi:hypothetical protein
MEHRHSLRRHVLLWTPMVVIAIGNAAITGGDALRRAGGLRLHRPAASCRSAANILIIYFKIFRFFLDVNFHAFSGGAAVRCE